MSKSKKNLNFFNFSFNSEAFVEFIFRHRKIVHTVTAITVLVSVLLIRQLSLKTDFIELLPASLPSVKSLKVASERMGGTSLLILGVVGPDYKSSRQAVDKLAVALTPWIGSRLSYIEYKYDDVLNFAEKYGMHYLSNDQLVALNKEVKEQIQKHVDQGVSSFLGIDDSDETTEDSKKSGKEAEKPLTNSPSGNAMLKFASELGNYRDAYISAENGKVLAMILKPFDSSLSIEKSEALLKDLDALIAAQNLQQINPKLKTVYAGSVPQAIEEFQSIKQDIVGTTVLLISLIVALLYIFFWSFRIILLLASNLVVAVLLTFAFAELQIGFLTTQTAFMSSLVAGTGINYAVIFITRFIELRRSDVHLKEALVRAFSDTKLPTLIAALTTSISFAVLGFSSNQGLAHFGLIGGLGIIFSWLVCFCLLPLWVYEIEKASHKVHYYRNPLARALRGFGRRLGDLVVDRYILILVLTGLFSIGMIPGLISLYNNPLEYNFNNIKNIPRSENEENIKLRERVYAAFPSSLTPSVIMGDSREEAAQFCPAVRKIIDETKPEDNVIKSCLGYPDLWREFEPVTPERKAAMNALAETLRSKLISHLDQGEFLGRMGRQFSMEAPTEKQLPEILVRRFRERNGQVGRLAFVSPDNSKPLDDARNLMSFTEHLEKVRVGEDQRPVSVASDSFILADLLKGIRREGPLLSGLAFGGVVIVCASLAGGVSAALLMSFALFMGVFWMLGLQGFLDYKYNFFNFTALPLTFGIGVDYPINLFIRYRQNGYKGYGEVFTGSGMGVLLCSLTTIVGYGTLLTSTSQALSGFGAIAIIGEFTCLTFAMLCLPAVIEVARRSPMITALRKRFSGSKGSSAV